MLVFFLVMSSLFNQNLKGIVYLAGVLLASCINIFLMNQIGSGMLKDASMSCDLIKLPILSEFNSPAPTSLFIAFTIAYLVLPMYYNNQISVLNLNLSGEQRAALTRLVCGSNPPGRTTFNI